MKNHVPPSADAYDDNPDGALACPFIEPGLKKEKLGIEGIGDENSRAPELPQLRKENPPEAGHGVDGSGKKEEKDDLHVNVGD